MPKPCSLLQQEPWRALCWGHVWGWHILLAVDTSVFFLSCSTARSELALTGSVSAEWCLAWHRAREHRQTLLREACGSRRDLGIIPPCLCSFPLWRPSLAALGSKRKAVEPQEGPAISTLAPAWSKPDFQRSTEQEQPPHQQCLNMDPRAVLQAPGSEAHGRRWCHLLHHLCSDPYGQCRHQHTPWQEHAGFLLSQLLTTARNKAASRGWGWRRGDTDRRSQGQGCSVFLPNHSVRQQKRDAGEHHHSLDWPSFCESPPWGGEN